MLNGDGSSDDLIGFFERLDDPTAPAAGVIDFDGFIAAFADGIDGLWASTMGEVSIVAGPDTYKLSAKTFRDRIIDTAQRGGVSLGSTSFADYATAHTAGWWTNKRMPATDANVQAGDPAPQGPAHDAGADAHGCLSVVGIFHNRRYLHRRAQRPAQVCHQHARRRPDPGAAGRLRRGDLPRFGLTERAGGANRVSPPWQSPSRTAAGRELVQPLRPAGGDPFEVIAHGR